MTTVEAGNPNQHKCTCLGKAQAEARLGATQTTLDQATFDRDTVSQTDLCKTEWDSDFKELRERLAERQTELLKKEGLLKKGVVPDADEKERLRAEAKIKAAKRRVTLNDLEAAPPEENGDEGHVGGATIPEKKLDDAVATLEARWKAQAPLFDKVSLRGCPHQDGGLQDNDPQDDSPQDNDPQDDSPQDDSPQDDSPQDDSPQDDSPQDDSPQDDSPQDDSPQDGGPQDGSTRDNAPDHGTPSRWREGEAVSDLHATRLHIGYRASRSSAIRPRPSGHRSNAASTFALGSGSRSSCVLASTRASSTPCSWHARTVG